MKVNREFECQECGRKEVRRATLDDIILCDECSAPMIRKLSAPQGTGNSAHGFLKKKAGFN